MRDALVLEEGEKGRAAGDAVHVPGFLCRGFGLLVLRSQRSASLTRSRLDRQGFRPAVGRRPAPGGDLPVAHFKRAAFYTGLLLFPRPASRTAARGWCKDAL